MRWIQNTDTNDWIWWSNSKLTNRTVLAAAPAAMDYTPACSSITATIVLREIVAQQKELQKDLIVLQVDKLLEQLGAARYLSTINFMKGYWKIPLSPSSWEKTTFLTPLGHFHFKTMSFGLHYAVTTFQQLMNNDLSPHCQYAAAYLDDIIYYSMWEGHLQHMKAVLGSLQKAANHMPRQKGKCGTSRTWPDITTDLSLIFLQSQLLKQTL